MKELVNKWNGISLIIRIVIGLIVGALLGLFAPQLTPVAFLGSMFVGALKAIAPILVFILVISSVAKAGVGIGKRFRTVIALYLVTTFLAAVVAVFASYAFPVTLVFSNAAEGAAPGGIWEVLLNLLNNIVSNPVASLMNANYIGILTWALLFGFALRAASESTKYMMTELSEGVSKVVRWIINLAPFGIMGLVFSSVSEYGLEG